MGLLTVLAIGLVAVAVATPTTVQVQFVDSNGIPIINNPVGVYDSQDEVIQKLAPRPTYGVLVTRGEKAKFELGDPAMGPRFVEAFIPMLFVEPLQISVPDAPNPLVAPANDLCDDAEFVMVPSVTAGTTVDALTDTPPACPGTGITSPGVWYEFMGTGNLVTADLCNGATSYDSKMSSYCLDCDIAICASDANDDSCGLQSAIDICTQAGATYRVLVHGFGGQTGPFELTLTEGGACSGAVDCTPPEPTGACCDCSAPPFNCEQMTASMCDAMGGNYFGDDVPCVGQGDIPDIYSSSPGLAIPDSNPVGVTDTISVGSAAVIGDVNIGIAITHTWIGDLFISVEHPDGTVVTLWDRACSLNDNMDVLMDDAGAVVVCATPTVGTYTPVSAGGDPLDALNGKSAFGDWMLFVSDGAGGDTGTLDTWTIEIGSGTPTCPDQNDGSCFLCDGTGGDDEDEDEDEDGDGEDDSGMLDGIGSGGGFIDLQDRTDTRSGTNGTDDGVVSEDDREDARLKVRRSTRSR
jgi:subtilisin-like proprotein convertase family protein